MTSKFPHVFIVPFTCLDTHCFRANLDRSSWHFPRTSSHLHASYYFKQQVWRGMTSDGEVCACV